MDTPWHLLPAEERLFRHSKRKSPKGYNPAYDLKRVPTTSEVYLRTKLRLQQNRLRVLNERLSLDERDKLEAEIDAISDDLTILFEGPPSIDKRRARTAAQIASDTATALYAALVDDCFNLSMQELQELKYSLQNSDSNSALKALPFLVRYINTRAVSMQQAPVASPSTCA